MYSTLIVWCPSVKVLCLYGVRSVTGMQWDALILTWCHNVSKLQAECLTCDCTQLHTLTLIFYGQLCPVFKLCCVSGPPRFSGIPVCQSPVLRMPFSSVIESNPLEAQRPITSDNRRVISLQPCSLADVFVAKSLCVSLMLGAHLSWWMFPERPTGAANLMWHLLQ